MRVTAAILFVLFATLAAACNSGPKELPPDETPANADRQAQLTGIFDRLPRDEATGKAAAKEAAAGDARDMRFLSSLWGTRTSDPLAARRLGAALSESKRNADALVWFQRAFLALDENDAQRPYVRYEIAQQYVAVGQRKEAVNLLANRMALEPLPDDLKLKYDALIAYASR